jgi:hypothetical protein
MAKQQAWRLACVEVKSAKHLNIKIKILIIITRTSNREMSVREK